MSDEEVTALLKAGARKRRQSKVAMFFFILFLFALPIALALWWFWPRPGPPRLLIAAYDQIALADEPTKLIAQVAPRDKESEAATLAGWPITFHELGKRPGGAALWHDEAKTSPGGVAVATWTPAAGTKSLPYAARYAPESKEAMAEDRGWVYLYPADTPLLLVDVEHSLAEASVKDWGTKNVVDIPGNAAAIKAVIDSALLKKYQPVYFTSPYLGIGQYRKARGWVHSRTLADGTLLPSGPVLSGALYAQGQEPLAYVHALLKELNTKFKGNVTAVTSDPDSAERFVEASLTTLFVGAPAKVPKGAVPVKSWEDLSAKLP
jgi:hypothetical protein